MARTSKAQKTVADRNSLYTPSGLDPFNEDAEPLPAAREQAPTARTSRTTSEAALDLGVGVVKGVAQGIHSIADFGAAITPGFEDDLKSGPIDTPLNWAEEKLQALKSEVLRVKEQKLASMIADPNVSVSEVASYFASNLSDLGAQVGIESLGAMAIGAGVTGALAKANAIRNIAAGSKLGAAAVGSIGEAMQIGGDVYRSTEGNVAAGGAGAAMGVLTSIATPGNVGGMIAKRFSRGATGEAVEGVEEVAAKGFLGRTLGEKGARGAVARAGTAVAAEGTQEFGQELLQSAIEQQSLTGEVDWTQASKKGVIGAMVGGPMGGGLHPVLGEGGVGTRQEINAARASLAAAEQAAAANPTDPTAQSNVDSARANLAAVSTTPEQASGAADAAVQAQTAEILSERTETVEQAVAGFSVQQDTSSDLRTGAQVAGEAQRAAGAVAGEVAAAASYNPETAEEDTGVAPRVSTAPVTASTASPITPDTPSATPSPTIEAPAPARRIANAQMIVGLGDNNPDIARVAAHVVGQNPITEIATQVARMSGDESAGTPITRPSTVPQPVWDEFVADAQRVTGIMVPFRLSGPARTVRDHLQEVFRTGSNPGRVIAQTLLASNNPNLGVNVEPFTVTDMARRPGARGYMLPNFQGEAEVIRMNPSSGTESAFLHETLHAITIRWLDHVSTTDPLYVELKTLMERVRAEADSRGVTHYGTHPGEDLGERRKMAEFLAEAMNRAVFQTFLDSIQVESNRTGWDTFVAWVGRLLGTTNARAISALDLALRVNQDVIDASARMSRGEPAATPEPAPVATPTPAPADPYAAARQAVVDLGWEDDAITDFENRSDEDLQGIIDTARRPTAAEFARQIIARRAAQPAPAPAPAAAPTPTAPTLAEAITRFREVGRQNGTSQNTLNDILDMLREFVGVITEADVRTEIAELETDNDHARADVLRAMLADRATYSATPTQTPVEAARAAYLARQAAEGVEPDRARGLADTIENYDESELWRITSARPGAYWPQAVTYAQAILVSRAATPAPTTTPAPAAEPPLRTAVDVARQAVLDAGYVQAAINNIENASDTGLVEHMNDIAYQPVLREFARIILNQRGMITRLTEVQFDARENELETAISNLMRVSQRTRADIISRLENADTDVLERLVLGSAQTHAAEQARAARVTLAFRNGTPLSTTPAPAAAATPAPARAMTLTEAVAALTNAEDAYISEQMSRFGLTEQQAEQERDAILSEAQTATDEEHQEGLVQYRRLTENAAAALSEAARQYNAVRRGNPPPATTAPTAAPAPAADEGTRLRQALITYYRDDYGSSNPEALATSLDNADAAQLGALSTNQGVAPAVAAYARYIMQSRGAPLTSAQRAARTRARNRFIGALREHLTTFNGNRTEHERQQNSEFLINQVGRFATQLRRHPHRDVSTPYLRSVRGMINSLGSDEAVRWMTDMINQQNNTTPTINVIPPRVQAAISARVAQGQATTGVTAADLQSDFAQARDALDQRGWPLYEGSGLSLTRVEAMTDPELAELRRWGAGNAFPRTQAVAEALINVRANTAGRALPYPRFTAGAAPASTPTSTPATPFASRARAMLGTGKLERLAQFWREVIQQRGMKTASDLVNIDDLIGQDTQATANELARRYNQALHQRAVEWARANNQPDPPYQDMIVAIENTSPGTARGRVNIKTRGLARRGNPFLPQMTSPNPRFTWREHTLGGAGSSFDTGIHATGLEETPGSSEIFYTLAGDMARIKGNQGFYSDTILSTVNNLRRQVQSTMTSLRTNNPRLINPLTGQSSGGPQGMDPNIWNAATDEEKIGLNILRYVESVIGRRGGNAVSLGNIFKNIRALPDGTFVDSSTNQSLTYADIERMMTDNQTFVRDQGTGGVGITAATFGILGNTVAEMLERDANADITPFVQAAVDIGRRNAGWLFSQDAARDIQGELESLMAENAMPNTSAERRAEINAEIRALQDERAQAPESDDFDFDAADRMFNELGPASEAARVFAAAGAGRATRPVDTNSAEFKRWFGDSKVVDADGKPLRVYHGTAADISAFEFPDEARSMGGLFGHFFTSDPAFAAKYGNAVMPTYLSIKNPKVVSVDELGAMQGSRAGERERRWAIEDGYDGAVTSDGKVWMAFEPTQIKSAIGNTGAFSDTTPNILYSMDAVPSDAEVANSPASRIAITTAPVSPPSQNEVVIAGRRKNNFFERLTEVFREKVQDKDVTLRRVMQTINNTSTIDAMDRFAGLVQSSLENLVSRPMADIEATLLPLQLGEGARAIFEEYLKMRHAREYNAHVASISPLQFDAYGNRMSGFGLNEHPGSGIRSEDAANYMAREHRPEIIEAARLYDKMTRSLQDFAVETGLEDQATINTWRNMFPNYTPFRRVLDMEENLGTGSGFSVREGISRRALGSSAEIVDPLVATLEQAARIVERGEKARVAQTMLNTARTAPTPMFRTRGGQIKPMWKINTTPNILTTKRLRVYNILDNNGQIMRNDSGIPMEFYNGGEARAYARLLTQPDPRKVFTVSDTGFHERVVTAHNPAYINKDNVVIIPENGENTMLVFDEDSEDAMAMARNFKNLDTVQVSAFLSAPNAFSRWVVGTSTGYNPMFAPINFIRDIFSSAVNINSANIPGWTKADSVKLMANATKNIGPLLVYLHKQHAARHSNNTSMPVAAPGSPAAIMERAKAAGGLTGVRESFTTYEDSLRNIHRLFGENVTPPADPRVRNDRANRIANGITEASDAFGRFLEGDVRNRVAKRLSDLPVAIGNLNNAFELATRVAAFDGAVRKFEAAGMSRAEAEAKAAVVSKNVSVNFNRRGQMTGFFNALYPFFNAAMQGSARLAELLFKKEQVKNADGEYEQRTKLTPLGKKVAMAFPALGAFQALLLAAAGFDDDQPPEWVRSRNFVIPLGGKEFGLIPMPLGLNALFNMGRSATDAMLHPENAVKHIRSAFTEIPAAFNPLGNTPNALLQVTPAVGDIPVSMLMNRDAFDRPIFKEDRDPRRPTPGWTRNKEGTSEFAIGIAKQLNNNSGGNEYRPGFFNFTGDQIEYFFGQLGGGITREAIKGGQFAFGSQTSEDRPWYKVPLVGKFRGSAGDSAAVRDRLYTTSAELNVLNAEYKGLKEDRKFAEAAAFLKENPEVRLHDDFDRYFKAEGKVRKERTELQREGKGEAVAEINTDLRTKGEKLIAEVERIRSAGR